MEIPYDRMWIGILEEHVRVGVERSGTNGVVLGLSGGLDSAVTMALAVQSLGSDRVVAVFMPSSCTPPEDGEHARSFASSLGVELLDIGIEHVLHSFNESGVVSEGMAGANLHSRTRMCILYNLANSRSLLVIGTGNKTELMVGYFTKYGDGASDLSPLGDLYKTQVRMLAADLGVPQSILDKRPSASLPGVGCDEEEIGFSYNELDRVLYAMEFGWDDKRVASETDMSPEAVARVRALIRRSRHKRGLGLIPKIGIRTIGNDLREDPCW